MLREFGEEPDFELADLTPDGRTGSLDLVPQTLSRAASSRARVR